MADITYIATQQLAIEKMEFAHRLQVQELTVGCFDGPTYVLLVYKKIVAHLLAVSKPHTCS